MQRVISLSIKQVPLLVTLMLMQVLFTTTAQGAPQEAINTLSNTCSAHTAAEVYGNRYVAGSSGQITAINVKVPSTNITSPIFRPNFVTTTYLIMANNGTKGPVTTLATFTPDTLTSTIARYVGSYQITAGTRFWIMPGQLASNFPDCFASSPPLPNANMLFYDGWRIDTATASAWSSVSAASIGALGSSNVAIGSLVFPISIEYIPVVPATIVVSLQSGGNTATFRQPASLRATANTEGRVTFYHNGKVIAGCRNLQTSSQIASCNWKPSVHGGARISAAIFPTDTSIPSGVSSVLNVGVSARTNNR